MAPHSCTASLVQDQTGKPLHFCCGIACSMDGSCCIVVCTGGREFFNPLMIVPSKGVE